MRNAVQWSSGPEVEYGKDGFGCLLAPSSLPRKGTFVDHSSLPLAPSDQCRPTEAAIRILRTPLGVLFRRGIRALTPGCHPVSSGISKSPGHCTRIPTQPVEVRIVGFPLCVNDPCCILVTGAQTLVKMLNYQEGVGRRQARMTHCRTGAVWAKSDVRSQMLEGRVAECREVSRNPGSRGF